MPITEAMSMGIPVVVTNWSGVTSFVDESVGYLVDYSLVPVSVAGGRM
jgi:glycosyltransferase involved in cell wall biosynthesis